MTWLKLTPSQGAISSKNPEQRVFATVSDWTQLAAGSNAAQITFTATASGQPPLPVTAMFYAIKNSPSSGFKGAYGSDCCSYSRVLRHTKGFVEGDGVISIEAAHATRNTTVQGVSWTELPGLGRTVSAVTPLPLSDQNYAAGTGPTL